MVMLIYFVTLCFESAWHPMGTLYREVEQDIWTWMEEFVTEPNEFYGFKFPPCPYARSALLAKTVDVVVWESGNFQHFIQKQAEAMRDTALIGTRVMAFPPRAQEAWGISDFVETLNMRLVKDNVFLNTGVSKFMSSRYPGSQDAPYFLVVANSLDAVLKGAKALQRSQYYQDWPKSHYQIVVERRARMAERYGNK